MLRGIRGPSRRIGGKAAISRNEHEEIEVYLILIIYYSEGKKRFFGSAAYYPGRSVPEDLGKDTYAP